ncbi:hypothetical protein CROQUDRAFT_131641 [Cronartium quercuum f. sp. fusiforme G11]|uniref:Aldehyde dehydrogenase n=1 Tax=Cronartium quercuum f. sp. fusiforme G11 TaxID=708437 RepID=A0A9P6NKW7_9BASI|nr:hypothetical protein CROQUDRAFT_131641 [Cronartium quercuum f. sp. fusiforme G11]
MSSQTSPNEFPFEPTSVDSIPQIHQELRKAFSTNNVTKTLEWRTHQLKQLGYLLQENEALLEDALTADLGRPKAESQIDELVATRRDVLNALSNVKSWSRPHRVKTDLTWLVTSPKTYHEPKGLVLIIGAWNYPIALVLGPLVGAIAGGNAAILKLSENAPSTASLLGKLIPQYMDNRHIRVINGGVEQVTALLDLRFDHIFFTGSTSIGKIVAKKAAENLTPVTLELGGKCPAIVFDDADFKVAGRRLIWAKAVNAGQTCIAPDYILVSKKNEAKLIESLKQAIREFYPAKTITAHPPFDTAASSGAKPDSINPETLKASDNQFCKIVNLKQFHRLTNLLRETRGEINTLDGTSQLDITSSDVNELKIPLTLVRNVTRDDALMQEEIFGPILPIITYDNESEMAEVLRAVSNSEPLAIYVFTQASPNFEFVRQNTKSGQIIQNDLLIQFVIPGLPFGGIGQSGMGNYHGYHSFLTFTYERASANLSPWADFLFACRYPPYTSFKSKLFSLIMGPSQISGKAVIVSPPAHL